MEQYQNLTALKFLVRKLRYLLGYKRDRVYNRDAVDDIFERLYGVRLATKVIEAENDAEVCREIDMFGTTELIVLLNNTDTFKALIDLINLYNEIRSVQDDIRRNSKNNRETSKRTRKRFDELKEYYEESIKDMRKYLGLEKLKSGISGKYRNLEMLRGGKSGKKSPYRKNQNNLFGNMDDDDDDLDSYIDEKWGGDEDVYHPYSSKEDDEDSRHIFTPRSAKSSDIYNGELGALIAKGMSQQQKKKKKPVNQTVNEYALYQSLRNKYEQPVQPEPEKKSDSNDAVLKMAEMMMTMMMKNQSQSVVPPVQVARVDNSDLASINSKLDNMSEFMNGIAHDMIEVQSFMDDVSNTRQRAKKLARNIKQNSGIGMSQEELEDDDDDDSSEPAYMKAIQNGCKDYKKLVSLVNQHYTNRFNQVENKEEFQYLVGEKDILLKWVAAICSNDFALQEQIKEEMAHYVNQWESSDEDEEEDATTGYMNIDVDDLLDEAEQVVSEHQPRPASHLIDEYNNSHAQ